jgi:predicted ATPase
MIQLAPLRLEDLQRLVAETLRCDQEAAGRLAELLHEKTGGNPFFAVQFLTGLADEGLLHFDRDGPGWRWDLDRIRAKGYSDNAVELIVGKLRRLPESTRNALQKLACVGNVAEIATLRTVFAQPEEDIHAPFLEAVRAGLVLRLESSYAFPHDRIHEAAYALIPEGERAGAHLRIGRVLLARMTADDPSERLFDVANQLNRAATLPIDHEEKVRVAAIDLRAGRTAKASAAYASARTYFAAGMGLLEEEDWGSQYELTFRLWLDRAECELLCGDSEETGRLIEQLLPRAASKIDEAAVYGLKVQLQTMKSENQQAVTTALECLRGFGIDMPAHPTEEQVQSGDEALRQAFDGRPIESLLDLPLMTDPELQAAMLMLSALISPAYSTDLRLVRLQLSRMACISLQSGASMDSATGYAYLGLTLAGSHRYRDAYRFAKLAFDFINKHGFIANRGRVQLIFGIVASWTQPIATAIDLLRTSIPTATETGNLAIARYSLYFSPQRPIGLATFLTYLLLRGDSLDSVWRESEMGLSSVQKAKYRDAADIVLSQQRFIANMQGRTATFFVFNDAQFDEATFEAQLTADRMPQLI